MLSVLRIFIVYKVLTVMTHKMFVSADSASPNSVNLEKKYLTNDIESPLYDIS